MLDQPSPFSGEFFGWSFPKHGIGQCSQKLPYDVLFRVPKKKGENNDFEVDELFADLAPKIDYAPSDLTPEAESKALMKMHGFPASIDLENSDFLLRVLNRAFIKLFSKTNMKGYTHAQAIASIVPRTSAGFPANYNGHKEKRSVLETMSFMLAMFYCVCTQYHVIFSISLKDELRPKEKVEAQKTRAFIISPVEHIYVCARVFGPFVEHFYSTRGTPSAIGVSPFNGEWHKEFSPLLDHSGLCGDSDGSAFDLNQRTNVHVLVLKFILQFLAPELHSTAIWAYREAICGFTITQQGYVFRRTGHNPSGWLLTAVVNTLVMYVMLACSFFDRYGYTDETFEMWFKFIVAKIFGDDNEYAVSRCIAHEYTPALILKNLSFYAPFEGSTWFKPPTHVVFLQAYSRRIQGQWVPHFLSEKCWSSLYYVHKDLTAVQKLSKYASLLKIYWFNEEFRGYLLKKVRKFIARRHDACQGDPSWDSLVLECQRDFTLVYRFPQCRVILNKSPIKDYGLLMSAPASITAFDKLAHQVSRDATKQSRKKEKQPATPEKQLKRLFKGVYGRGLHSSLKSHSSYYRSLVDPFNNAGAKVPNTVQFLPTGTIQVFERRTMSAVGSDNRFGIWVRPSLLEGIRTLGYASGTYGWSAAGQVSAYGQLQNIVQELKPVSVGLAIQFLGNFNSNDGEYVFSFIPAKFGRDNLIVPQFNFMAPQPGDAIYDNATKMPYMRTLPINQGGGFITWRPTDFDSLNFWSASASPSVVQNGVALDPLGSLMIMGTGAANQTLKFRVTIVYNYEVIPAANYTNIFNMSAAINDPLEMSNVQYQLQQRLVPVSTNTKVIAGAVNTSAESSYSSHHEPPRGMSSKLMETMLPLVEGIEKLSLKG